MNEMECEKWAQSASEVAKNSTFTFVLEGWPAAVTLTSVPMAVVLICAIKAFSPQKH